MALYGMSLPTGLRGLLSCCYGGRSCPADRSAWSLETLPLGPGPGRRERDLDESSGASSTSDCVRGRNPDTEHGHYPACSEYNTCAAAAAATSPDGGSLSEAFAESDVRSAGSGGGVPPDQQSRRRSVASSVATTASIATGSAVSSEQRRRRQQRRQQQPGTSAGGTTSPSSARSVGVASAASAASVPGSPVKPEVAANVPPRSAVLVGSASTVSARTSPQSRPQTPRSKASGSRAGISATAAGIRGIRPAGQSGDSDGTEPTHSEVSTHPQSAQLDDALQIEDFNDGVSDEAMRMAYGDVKLGQEELNGTTERKSKIPKIGTLEVLIKYDNTSNLVTVRIVQTHELPRPGTFKIGGKVSTLKWNAIQIAMALLPEKKQRHRTVIAKGDNPQFDKTFLFNEISTVDFGKLGIRFRAYGCEHKRRKLLMAENVLALASLATPKNETSLHLPLELRAGDYGGKHSSDDEEAKSEPLNKQEDWTSLGVTGFPELFIGITYNATTGQLAVEVIKGSSFKLPGMLRTPDTYVKLSLMASNGHVLYKSKTPSSDGTPNPNWKENFVFPVNKFQLTDVTLMLAVYSKKTMNRREIIGWFSVGSNNSGEEELAHWQDVIEAKGTQVCRWHRLLQSDKKL